MTEDVALTELRLTKRSGALRQLEAAIDHLYLGHFDIAITLAGAAEGMLPAPDDIDMFRFLKESTDATDEFGKPEWMRVLNGHKEWLKHPTIDQPQEITLNWLDAAAMINRAAFRYGYLVWGEKVQRYMEWYVAFLDNGDTATGPGVSLKS
jgi:hypothetical protein